MSRFWDSFANNVAPGIVAGHSMYLRGQQSNRENVQTQMLQEKLDEMRKERELSGEISQIAPYNTVEDVSGQSPAYGEGEYQPQGMVTERQVPKTSYQMFLEKAQMAGQKQSPAMEEHYTKMAQNALKQQAERFELLLKVNPKKAIEFNNNNPDLRGIFGELEYGADEKGQELLTSYGPDGKPVALHSIIRGEGGKQSISTKWLKDDEPKVVDWGYGQKKDLKSGEVFPVPTKPEKDKEEKTAYGPKELRKDSLDYRKGIADLRKEYYKNVKDLGKKQATAVWNEGNDLLQKTYAHLWDPNVNPNAKEQTKAAKSGYASPDLVKQAFKNGTISREEATSILRSDFGMK